MKNFTKLISFLFYSQVQTHIFHLQAESFAEHKVLNDFYTSIPDLIDDLAESFQGKYGKIKEGFESFKIKNYSGLDGTIYFLEEILNEIKNLRKELEDSFIQSQIDNVEQLFYSTLYKLKLI